jgi:anti-sigma regulatory factor (Ser/Thr protein kinase)
MSSPEPPVRTPGRRLSVRPPGQLDLDQPFETEGLYALRATLAAHASSFGIPTKQIEALLIIASELASNAIRHGGGGGRLRMWRADGLVHCQVIDRGPGIADPAVGTEPPDPASTAGGRGLWICRNLASEIVIESGPDGRGAVVTATLAGAPSGSVPD